MVGVMVMVMVQGMVEGVVLVGEMVQENVIKIIKLWKYIVVVVVKDMVMVQENVINKKYGNRKFW
jgi:hypothetical protein